MAKGEEFAKGEGRRAKGEEIAKGEGRSGRRPSPDPSPLTPHAPFALHHSPFTLHPPPHASPLTPHTARRARPTLTPRPTLPPAAKDRKGASRPPSSPLSAPSMRNGLRTKPSVAPTSRMIEISRARARPAHRIRDATTSTG